MTDSYGHSYIVQYEIGFSAEGTGGSECSRLVMMIRNDKIQPRYFPNQSNPFCSVGFFADNMCMDVHVIRNFDCIYETLIMRVTENEL